MKAHISDKETKMQEEIYDTLDKVRQSALGAGAKAISKVVYEKATETGKTDRERLDEIIRFCKVGLAIKVGKQKDPSEKASSQEDTKE